jgi:predicted component of type VI protein secretion system
VPFQLFRKNNIESSNHFSTGDLHEAAGGTVSVGASPRCAVRIADPSWTGEQFMVQEDGENHFLTAFAGQTVYRNDKPVSPDERIQLRSGDEIRVGHWTFRFRKLHARARFSRNAELLTIIAKVVVGLVIVIEISLVMIGPRHMHKAALFQREQAMQTLEGKVDRFFNAIALSTSEDQALQPAEKAARQALRIEVNRIKSYLKKNRTLLTEDGIHDMDLLVEEYMGSLDKLKKRELLRPVPDPALEAAVRRIINGTPGTK